MELYQVNKQWSSRPSDERYLDLSSMLEACELSRSQSASKVVSTRKLEFVPDADHKGLTVQGPNGHAYAPTHWAFGQLATLAGAPAGYLRSLPSDLSADLLNYGLKHARDVEDVGVLLQRNGSNLLRAATGPNYGRIWDVDIVRQIMEVAGDGVTGDWRVPGVWGKPVPVTKETTTLFRGDRDFFVFLCDEHNPIELKSDRGGSPGALYRGWFAWNSEVGSTSWGLATFTYRECCANRIIWGAEGFKEMRIRHTASAPDKFFEQIVPALKHYSNSSTAGIVQSIEAAQKAKIQGDVEDFLAKRFSRKLALSLNALHLEEEDRPIESLWDVTNAVTAYARGIEHQNERVSLEKEAGKFLELAV